MLRFTKYEEARIIGARALQVAMGAPILVPITPEEFERMLAKYSRRVVSKHVSETLGARTETTTTTGPGGAPEPRSIALIEAKVRELLSRVAPAPEGRTDTP